MDWSRRIKMAVVVTALACGATPLVPAFADDDGGGGDGGSSGGGDGGGGGMGGMGAGADPAAPPTGFIHQGGGGDEGRTGDRAPAGTAPAPAPAALRALAPNVDGRGGVATGAEARMAALIDAITKATKAGAQPPPPAAVQNVRAPQGGLAALGAGDGGVAPAGPGTAAPGTPTAPAPAQPGVALSLGVASTATPSPTTPAAASGTVPVAPGLSQKAFPNMVARRSDGAGPRSR